MNYDLNDLYFFVQVVDHGGFAPAGRALGMPKSRLSRRIALLEDRLGIRLIHRTTRRFTVTPIGETYYRHCKAMLVEAEAAEEAIETTRSEPRGTVRMSCPVALLQSYVGDMLAEFMQQYPLVNVALDATNRRVDVVGEGIDVAIRVRPPPLEDSDLVLRALADRGQCLLASPGLVEEHGGEPSEPKELATWPTLGLGSPQEEFTWHLFGPEDKPASVPHTPRLVTTDMSALRKAAVAGIGVVQLPRMMVRPELDAGRLVPVLPRWTPRREIVHAVFPSRRDLLPAVRALIDHLAGAFSALHED
ncbi:LysR family transcriptional regulator [Aquisalimonas lutea]|uniref:LysR family transcriptional regulator n=1 Tax=Aquisalimonas lutea TaxID=1327750 RepID=UPI0025B53958|nr:LysR family transcriptional regulator [Aquisalimonas lutea]MDN3516379.1 LysR family transcriptional regulator [Aquisalimonas lutea]